ncbi:hypothetical protein PILCRDRAFT_813038 [Piloderma croceum F 1598]|uniref:Uncharacterized protein n=1 Tax=Piloderma croceum (strain F 1598) TaxID=765440 RepID=A0A0C3GEQ6_PILCF|nr:hypothetical protein PILCRDRAFT_813038 [Piloderma croceum F 1598]
MSAVADKQLKKTEQVAERPITTDHNINEEYMQNPPDNLAAAAEMPTFYRQSRGVKEGAKLMEDENPGVIGHQDKGRAKKADVESSIVQDNSIHS